MIEAFRDGTGLEIHDGYGQTETGQLTGQPRRRAGPRGLDGHAPCPASSCGSVDGELQLRVDSCPTFFARYLDGEPFTGEWWPTGDVVSEEPDGYLFFEGRDDDLILSAGYRIGPFEVESALLEPPRGRGGGRGRRTRRPSAARSSARSSSSRGREPSDELARELQEHVKSVTAPYKYPRIVDFADELPRTASGKVKRAELRQ